MSVLAIPLVQFPNDFLWQKALPLASVNVETRKLVKRMLLTMHARGGCGLAAPQVGLRLRLIVVQTETADLAMINPVIIAASQEFEKSREGCLSLPGFFTDVMRHKSVVVRFTDEHGALKKGTFSGRVSHTVQHEIDHLDGITIKDKKP